MTLLAIATLVRSGSFVPIVAVVRSSRDSENGETRCGEFAREVAREVAREAEREAVRDTPRELSGEACCGCDSSS